MSRNKQRPQSLPHYGVVHKLRRDGARVYNAIGKLVFADISFRRAKHFMRTGEK